MESSSYSSKKLLEIAKEYFDVGKHIKSLKLIEEISSDVQGNDKQNVSYIEGRIFLELGESSCNNDLKFVYLLASLECFSRIDDAETVNEIESKMNDCMTVSGNYPVKEIVWEWKVNERLKSYWSNSTVDFKRKFMKVSILELKHFVEDKSGELGLGVLEKTLKYVKKKEKWVVWLCRSCSNKFPTREECKNHLEQAHDAKFIPSSAKDIPQRISEAWAGKISVGGWEPVDAVAAVQMIKNRLADVKAFAYQDGWCKDWCLAEDRERRTLLKEIRSLLVSFIEHQVLSESTREWVMSFVVQQLKNLQVSRQTLTDCHLVETPQSICFLECGELSQILDFLRKIKCKRDDGRDLVCRAVDRFCQSIRFKEKIDFDSDFSFLLLDKRLLKGEVDHVDDEGKIRFFDPALHYANVQPCGDKILTWLTDFSREDDGFEFPLPVDTHNFDNWVAILRAVQFTCKTLGAKYAEKLQFLDYDSALTSANELCGNTTEWNDQDDVCASLLCHRCEEIDSSTLFCCVVRDILVGGSPTFDISKDWLKTISEHVVNKAVQNNITQLRSMVNQKLALIDSKILLLEKTRIERLNQLSRIGFFDYRSYISPPLKKYLLSKCS